MRVYKWHPGEQFRSRGLFALRFSQWRKHNHLPLKIIAEGIGVAMSTIAGWENGQRFPTAENLDAISQYTGLPICLFFSPGKVFCSRFKRRDPFLEKRSVSTRTKK